MDPSSTSDAGNIADSSPGGVEECPDDCEPSSTASVDPLTTMEDQDQCNGVSSTIDALPSSSALCSDDGDKEETPVRSRRGPKLSKQEKYLRMKEHRRLKRKELKERQKQKKKANREAALLEPSSTSICPPPQCRLMADSSCSQRIAVDCSFDNLMSLKDVCKLHHQLNQCYGLNRRAANPTQFHLTGVSGQLAKRFEETDNALGSRWDVHVHESGLMETFESAELVYLSSEAETTMEQLRPDKVYVIGGLVDHNHHKGHCFNMATAAGLATERLPIERHVALNSRSVLTVNHVFHILLLMTESGDWSSSIRQVVPRRKWCADAAPEADDAQLVNSTTEDKSGLGSTEAEEEKD